MRILMYYDGTDDTREALPNVKQRATAMNAKVYVMSSFSRWGDVDTKMIEERENGLNYIKSVLEKENVPCETHLLMVKDHNPGDDILDIASKYQVDEIIIGTDRKSNIEKFIPGWLVNHVISRAKCPVLIV